MLSRTRPLSDGTFVECVAGRALVASTSTIGSVERTPDQKLYGTPVRFTNATNRGSRFIRAKNGAAFANPDAADRWSTARDNHAIAASESPSSALGASSLWTSDQNSRNASIGSTRVARMAGT